MARAASRMNAQQTSHRGRRTLPRIAIQRPSVRACHAAEGRKRKMSETLRPVNLTLPIFDRFSRHGPLDSADRWGGFHRRQSRRPPRKQVPSLRACRAGSPGPLRVTACMLASSTFASLSPPILQTVKAITALDNVHFIQGDVSSYATVIGLLDRFKIDTVVHVAAQSHVDNSFGSSIEFTHSNVLATHVLLEAVRDRQQQIR